MAVEVTPIGSASSSVRATSGCGHPWPLKPVFQFTTRTRKGSHSFSPQKVSIEQLDPCPMLELWKRRLKPYPKFSTHSQTRLTPLVKSIRRPISSKLLCSAIKNKRSHSCCDRSSHEHLAATSQKTLPCGEENCGRMARSSTTKSLPAPMSKTSQNRYLAVCWPMLWVSERHSK